MSKPTKKKQNKYLTSCVATSKEHYEYTRHLKWIQKQYHTHNPPLMCKLGLHKPYETIGWPMLQMPHPRCLTCHIELDTTETGARLVWYRLCQYLKGVKLCLLMKIKQVSHRNLIG